MQKLFPARINPTLQAFYLPDRIEDIRLNFAPINNGARKIAAQRMRWRGAPGLLATAFGLEKMKRLSWCVEVRRHKYAFLNLPVWYLDQPCAAGASDLQSGMAVNGQTRKAAALFLEAGKKDEIRALAANPVPKMPEECTKYSPPVPIVYQKQPFLYRALPFEGAAGKPKNWFLKFFKG